MEILKQLAWTRGRANYVTLSRIALAGLLVYLIFNDNLIGMISVFLLAISTDAIDGWVARKNGIVSELGKVLDPVADKILMGSVFISRIVFLNFWLSWIFLLILAEEVILITLGAAGFFYREKIGQKLGSNWFGKFKLGSHCLIAFFLLVFSKSWYQGWSWLNLTIISLVVVATLLGGLSIFGHIRDQGELVRKILLRRKMFDLIRHWFPINVDSIEKFAEMIKREQCTDVEVNRIQKPAGYLVFPVNGFFTKTDLFDYSIQLISVTPSGERVIYTELLIKSFGSTQGLSDSGRGGIFPSKIFTTAKDRLEELVNLLKPYTIGTHLKISLS